MKTYKTNKTKGIGVQCITSIISTTLVLLLVGGATGLILAAHNLSVYVRENVNFSVIINDNMSDRNIKKIQKHLELSPFTKEVVYISKDQALKEQTEALGTNPEDFLGYNPFQASLEIKLKANYVHPDSIKKIEKEIRMDNDIEEILYRKDLIEQVDQNIGKAGFFLSIMAAVFGFISFALINNTIRMDVYSKRFLIHTMKLVGASWGFIRAPFINRSLWIGIISSLLANTILTGGGYALVTSEMGLIEVISPKLMLIVCSCVMAFGLLITCLCAWFSINHYLRMKASTLYTM